MLKYSTVLCQPNTYWLGPGFQVIRSLWLGIVNFPFHMSIQKKYSWYEFGDYRGHAIDPFRPTHCKGNSSSNQLVTTDELCPDAPSCCNNVLDKFDNGKICPPRTQKRTRSRLTRWRSTHWVGFGVKCLLVVMMVRERLPHTWKIMHFILIALDAINAWSIWLLACNTPICCKQFQLTEQSCSLRC